MELQVHVEEFRKRGLNVAAISYDSAAVLKNFAMRRNITFPLLSDYESRVIREFGILNESIERTSSIFGVPYPGTYVVDQAGIVTGKYFEADYEERVTASDILARQFGAQPAASPSGATGKHLSIRESSSARMAIGGQKLALILTIEMKPGIHVYAPGVQGYKPVSWEMTSGRAKLPARLFTDVAWPRAKLLHLRAIGETVPVYEKSLRLVREFTVPSDLLLREATGPDGTMTLDGEFRYQACDATTCFNPETIPVRFELQILRHDAE